MRITISTLSDEAYWPLTQVTAPNKLEYALRWGYQFKLTKLPAYDPSIRLKQMLVDLDDCDWLWHLDTDAVITNLGINALDLANPGADVVISEDPNGINNGSIFLRNCERVAKFLRRSIDRMEDGHADDDQAAMAMLIGESEKWRVTKVSPKITGLHVKICPQRMFNSYPDMAYYGLDGDPGTWEQGDFVAHFPGMPMERRISRIEETLEMVVR